MGDVSIADADAIQHALSQVFTDSPRDLKENSQLKVTLDDNFFYITTPHKFRLSFRTSHSPSALMRILCMPKAAFHHAPELEFDINCSTNPPSDTMVQFFSLLAVAHSLRTDLETLDYIHQLSLRYDDTRLLPSLTHLELSNYREDLTKTIEQFLDYRRDAYGTPILSLTCRDLWGANLSNLERFDGLLCSGSFGDKKVHYVCGSGNPEKLDFTAATIVDVDPAIVSMENQ
ncbi:hypothetical protein CPC08DRAFT_820398 [Agrocybe pediades]|nr:hypothetical protein CPC08DRAFT_820398 [Agrocybe pediades]